MQGTDIKSTGLQVDTAQIAKGEGTPLLKVDLQLTQAEAAFEPWLAGKERPRCKELFEACLQAFLESANLVTQLESGTGDSLTTSCSHPSQLELLVFPLLHPPSPPEF